MGFQSDTSSHARHICILKGCWCSHWEREKALLPLWLNFPMQSANPINTNSRRVISASQRDNLNTNLWCGREVWASREADMVWSLLSRITNGKAKTNTNTNSRIANTNAKKNNQNTTLLMEDAIFIVATLKRPFEALAGFLRLVSRQCHGIQGHPQSRHIHIDMYSHIWFRQHSVIDVNMIILIIFFILIFKKLIFLTLGAWQARNTLAKRSDKDVKFDKKNDLQKAHLSYIRHQTGEEHIRQ